MNPPMINSTSSVSATKRKREAERSVNWSVEETQVLLCAWSDERVQKSLAENLRNRHVFKHLSARMSEMGYLRSPHQCRLRVKTLKANYMRSRLQRSINSSQPCTFKYYAEMDAVLGRRTHDSSGEELGRFDELDSMNSIPAHPNPNIDLNPFGPFKISGPANGRYQSSHQDSEVPAHRGCPRGLQQDSEVKLENGGELTDDSDVNNTGFPQNHRERRHGAVSISSIHREPSGSSKDIMLSLPSPQVASPLPPCAPPPPPSAPPPPCLEPAMQPLWECFQSLVSESRVLLVQLETQRMEQARWYQEVLSQWMQREERRQREEAHREERREKARMDHEIRVLELLTFLSQERGCRCGSAAPVGPNHIISLSTTNAPQPIPHHTISGTNTPQPNLHHTITETNTPEPNLHHTISGTNTPQTKPHHTSRTNTPQPNSHPTFNGANTPEPNPHHTISATNTPQPNPGGTK